MIYSWITCLFICSCGNDIVIMLKLKSYSILELYTEVFIEEMMSLGLASK